MTENSSVRRLRAIGFGKRLGAIFIDGFVLLFIPFILLFTAGILLAAVNVYDYTTDPPYPADTLLLLSGLAAPAACLLSIWFLGPSLRGLITDLFQGL